MDQVTLDRIQKAHPKIREMLISQYKEANNKLNKGVRLRFTRVYSSPEEQNEIYAQGRTNPGKIVTNAKAWESIHNYGLAFDIVLLIDKNKDGKFEEVSWDMVKDFDSDGISDWLEVVTYFKSKGWKWGGDWKKFKDGPHFQYDFGFDWKTLKARYDKGITIKDSNGITYVKI